MKKIDWKNTEATNDEYSSPIPGGYILAICNVEDDPQKEYLKIFYDIVGVADPRNEEFIGYYGRMAERYSDRKLPCLYRSYKQNALGFFKTFLVALEKSNDGFIADDFDGDELRLQGMVFGAVMGLEEYVNQKGELRANLKIRQIHSVATIEAGDFKIPDIKKLEGYVPNAQPSTAAPAQGVASYQPAPFENEIPF